MHLFYRWLQISVDLTHPQDVNSSIDGRTRPSRNHDFIKLLGLDVPLLDRVLLALQGSTRTMLILTRRSRVSQVTDGQKAVSQRGGLEARRSCGGPVYAVLDVARVGKNVKI